LHIANQGQGGSPWQDEVVVVKHKTQRSRAEVQEKSKFVWQNRLIPLRTSCS